MELSRRLYTVASAVSAGNRLVDVGTDHGYVPIYLVSHGICPSAIAMDVNQGPLERAESHIRAEGLHTLIQTRLSDGMAKLEWEETDSVVIAGMGGDLIRRILLAREDLLKKGLELVLQPQSEWFKVRHTLHEEGYRIIHEWFLKEDGKYYVVIKAVPGEETYPTETEYAYGSLLEEECIPVYREYLEKEYRKREGIIAGLGRQMEEDSREKTEGSIALRIGQLNQEMEKIKKRLLRLEEASDASL